MVSRKCKNISEFENKMAVIEKPHLIRFTLQNASEIKGNDLFVFVVIRLGNGMGTKNIFATEPLPSIYILIVPNSLLQNSIFDFCKML